jgi:hypothetical protein
VKGISADIAINKNIGSQFNILRAINELRHGALLKTILEDNHEWVKPCEVLLTLRKPGAGYITLLKMLINKRLRYAKVTRDVY